MAVSNRCTICYCNLNVIKSVLNSILTYKNECRSEILSNLWGIFYHWNLSILVSDQPAPDDIYVSDPDEHLQSPPVIAQVVRPIPPDGCRADQPTVNSLTKAPSVLINGSQLKSVPLLSNSQHQRAPLPPIPQHHYEQAQNQILVNKQMDSVKMKWAQRDAYILSSWTSQIDFFFFFIIFIIIIIDYWLLLLLFLDLQFHSFYIWMLLTCCAGKLESK